PLAWQWHGEAPYLSFRPGDLPTSVDAVMIDGPPHWTRRGREACLYAAFDRVKVGGRVYLDDFNRPAEQRMVRNWCRAYPGAIEVVRSVDLDDGVVVLEKKAEMPKVERSWPRLIDAYAAAAAQPISARVRRIMFR